MSANSYYRTPEQKAKYISNVRAEVNLRNVYFTSQNPVYQDRNYWLVWGVLREKALTLGALSKVLNLTDDECRIALNKLKQDNNLYISLGKLYCPFHEKQIELVSTNINDSRWFNRLNKFPKSLF